MAGNSQENSDGNHPGLANASGIVVPALVIGTLAFVCTAVYVSCGSAVFLLLIVCMLPQAAFEVLVQALVDVILSLTKILEKTNGGIPRFQNPHRLSELG